MAHSLQRFVPFISLLEKPIYKLFAVLQKYEAWVLPTAGEAWRICHLSFVICHTRAARSSHPSLSRIILFP